MKLSVKSAKFFDKSIFCIYYIGTIISTIKGHVFMYINECLSILADGSIYCDDCDHCQPSVSSETSLMIHDFDF